MSDRPPHRPPYDPAGGAAYDPAGRVVVSGAVVTEHLMAFPGSITDQLLPGRLETVSLSFLVDDLRERPGGAGANTAFGLGRLGLRPVLVGAAGTDGGHHADRLRAAGVDTAGLLAVPGLPTARRMHTTDRVHNRIAVLHPGAMVRAAGIRLADVLARTGPARLVLVGADDPGAVRARTEQCRAAGVPFAVAPAWLPEQLTGPAVAELLEGADLLFTDAGERDLLLRRTGWNADRVLERVGTWLTVLGPRGVRIERHGRPPVHVPPVHVPPVPVLPVHVPPVPVPPVRVPPLGGPAAHDPSARHGADADGAGDAFRAGYLAGAVWGLPPATAARVGCLTAALALEAAGPQEYTLEPAAFLSRLADAYGPATAEAVAPHLPDAVPDAASVRVG